MTSGAIHYRLEGSAAGCLLCKAVGNSNKVVGSSKDLHYWEDSEALTIMAIIKEAAVGTSSSKEDGTNLAGINHSNRHRINGVSNPVGTNHNIISGASHRNNLWEVALVDLKISRCSLTGSSNGTSNR